MAELLETERSYVKDLESAVQCFLIPMRRDPDQVPPPLLGHTDVLFGNVEEILAFHKSIFLKVSAVYGCAVSANAIGTRLIFTKKSNIDKSFFIYLSSKVQLISKCLFGIFNSPKKTERPLEMAQWLQKS